jgi:hypothetical protein
VKHFRTEKQAETTTGSGGFDLLPVKGALLRVSTLLVKHFVSKICQNLSKVKQFRGKLKQLSVTQNNLIIKLLYAVQFVGPESSVSIY